MAPRNFRANFPLRFSFIVAGIAALIPAAPAPGADSPSSAAPRLSSVGAVAAPAPVVPGEIVALLQEAKYEAARQALKDLREKAKTATEKAYLEYLQGIAERLGGFADAARDTLNAALNADPDGFWVPKIRFELAAVELASGNLAVAEELARIEAIRLLADDRKDRLAEVYHAFARKLLEPDDPIAKPDPNAAWELLVQARELAKSQALRARLLLSMGRTSQTAGNHPRAIENFLAYLAEYPQGKERSAARLQLGEAQLAASQPLPARLTWTDLARDLEKIKAAERTRETDEIRAMAMARIPATFGVPNPPDDTSLNLGVAALKRFLAAYPAHPLAVRSAYDVAASYLVRGKSDPAIAALGRFIKGEDFKVETEQARRDQAGLSMTAAFQFAQVLQGQQKFNEAIAAWKGYLATHPNGPQSADAQRAILDTQLLIAADHLARGHFPEARASWTDFVAQNPLDPRVPQVLFQSGESFVTEKKHDQAITAWAALTSKFPGSEPAAHAQFLTASILENEKRDPAAAIERFRKIQVDPWKSQALQRVAVMESKVLTVVTPRAFRSGETASLSITTRNLEKLTFAAYKLNPEAYFRKKHGLGNVESLDIGLVAPDAEWTLDVPGYAKFRPLESNYELKKLEQAGVYVVKVTDQKTLQATTLVVNSDLDAIVKGSQDQILIFAQDMKTGKGRPKARVLVSDGSQVLLEAETGADGVLLHDWSPPRGPGQRLTYLVVEGAHVAGSGLGIPGAIAQGLTPRAYLYTDRPAYRPGQKVSIRGVVREVRGGSYASLAGETYRFEVTDSRGRQLVARPVALSEFGTFHESLPLDSAAPVGTYRLRVFQPGKSDFAGSFEVQSYQLEPIDLSFDLKKTVYYRGETIEADILARYQYGAPVANRALEVSLPDGRILSVATDATGRYHVSFSTEGFAEEQLLQLVARLPQDNVAAGAGVMLAVRGFNIGLSTSREVYLDGESFALQVNTFDAQGKPGKQELTAAVIKRVNQSGRITERETQHKSIETDPTTGRGSVSFRIDDPRGGSYVLRVTGTDRFGNPIVADRAIFVSGKQDETRLRILADRLRYKVGEEASVNLHSRGRAGTVLLTWEADRILTYKLVSIKEGDNLVGWAIEAKQFPNFTLNAARMWENHFDQAKLDIEIERDLRVTVTPVKGTVGPGEPVELDVTTEDQLGRPVSAELSIALIDQSLLRMFADHLPAIGSFFYNQTRTGAFSTESTNTFRYAPATVPVAQAVVDEAERAFAMAANAVDRAGVVERAQVQVANTPVPTPAVMEAMAGMMGGGRGGMAGMMPGSEQPGSAGQSRRLNERQKVLRREALVARIEIGDKVAAGEMFEKDAKAKPDFVYQALGTRSRDEPEGEPRERFVETAYWNPLVVTGKDGKARVTFVAPSALSQYQVMAKGVTGADTLVGQTTSTLTVRKNFFVDLKVPASLTQGDKPRFIGRVHHLGVQGTVTLKLSIYSGGREEIYPKTVEIKGDGVAEVVFDPIDVPDTDSIRLTLNGVVGTLTDDLVVEIPVRPWGVQSFASASGTSSDGTAVFLALPQGRSYESPEMVILLSPTLQRMIIELALGHDSFVLRSSHARIFPPYAQTTSDRAADLMAATSAMAYLRATRASGSPDAQRLVQRIQGLVSELIAAQNEDGGWPWVGCDQRQAASKGQAGIPPSERYTTASVVWALASAEPLGLLTDPKVLDKSIAWLTQSMTAGNNSRDLDARSALLHALSTRKAASFEVANSLNRERQNLSNPALAYLALTFANLDRPELATEVLGLLLPRAKTEPVAPGRRARNYWDGSFQSVALRDQVETTALVSMAFARVRPQAAELEQSVDWLQAHRFGHGWNPHKAKGPALAALAAYHGRAKVADDRYRLTVTVNDTKVAELDITGPVEGRSIAVPAKALKAGDRNRVGLVMEGRGTFSYAATLTGFTRDFGPDQDRANRAAWVDRRVYWPAPPQLDGKVLPVGFGVALNAPSFENVVTQVALGARARVGLVVWRSISPNTPDWDRDFLVVEEHLPAGTTLIEGTVQSTATSYTLGDGVLTFYYAPDQNPGGIQYDVYGYLPGQYRTLPASVRSVHEPGRFHLGTPGDLRVLTPGEKSTDPYRASPDEQYARGKAHFDAGRHAEASASLEPLFSAYTLRVDVSKDAARMLLLINIKDYQARKVVQYFEVVKEKSPELILGFDNLLIIGRAYRDIKEYERAMIVWRGLIEASYVEDARVGELLRQRGRTLEAMAYLIDLWRSYPNTPSIEADFFGLSQVLAQASTKAFTDPNLRRELAAANVSRSELLLQTIRMIQVFLSQSPKNPMADEASLALVGAFLELEDYKDVVKLAGRFSRTYPKSTFLDSFQYSEALANFHLGQYDRAVEVAETIARASYKDASGVDQPSSNKWQALYILGQIFDARRAPGKALEYYRQVADRFTDAASAIQYYTRKDLKVPEISVVRPEVKPSMAGLETVPRPGGLQNVAPVAGIADVVARPGIKLEYRNIAKVDITVYPVDLMQLYLTRRNLYGIAGIDLAGITPLVEKSVVLGEGTDYDDRSKQIELPLTKEGAYLVMIRGENLYASGIVLVSPLELEVLEEPVAGRVRITVRDARTKAPLPKIQVKVIGNANPQFSSGETDLRGVFVAEGVVGQVTAVVRKEVNQYAFYRGTTYVGQPPQPAAPAQAARGENQTQNLPGLDQALDANLKIQNSSNSIRQIERLQNRYQQVAPGQMKGAAAGGFR